LDFAVVFCVVQSHDFNWANVLLSVQMFGELRSSHADHVADVRFVLIRVRETFTKTRKERGILETTNYERCNAFFLRNINASLTQRLLVPLSRVDLDRRLDNVRCITMETANWLRQSLALIGLRALERF
jgi:hypothetical protein